MSEAKRKRTGVERPRLTVGMLEAMAAALEVFQWPPGFVEAQAPGAPHVQARIWEDIPRAKQWLSDQLSKRKGKKSSQSRPGPRRPVPANLQGTRWK